MCSERRRRPGYPVHKQSSGVEELRGQGVRGKRCQNEPGDTSAQEQPSRVTWIEPRERKEPGLAGELPGKPLQSLFSLELQVSDLLLRPDPVSGILSLRSRSLLLLPRISTTNQSTVTPRFILRAHEGTGLTYRILLRGYWPEHRLTTKQQLHFTQQE